MSDRLRFALRVMSEVRDQDGGAGMGGGVPVTYLHSGDQPAFAALVDVDYLLGLQTMAGDEGVQHTHREGDEDDATDHRRLVILSPAQAAAVNSMCKRDLTRGNGSDTYSMVVAGILRQTMRDDDPRGARLLAKVDEALRRGRSS